MSEITYEQFLAMWAAMTEEERQPVKDKANWEHMTLWKVLNDYAQLRPQERSEGWYAS